MGNHKRLTLIEIILILAIAAILVVWLFPRFLKTLDSDSATNGMVKSPLVVFSEYAGASKFPEHIFVTVKILPLRHPDPGYLSFDLLGKKFHNVKSIS